VPSIPRDLSVIVRKAVEKDPRMRYASAAALAADLDAFIEDRPIAARPPTLGYVLRLAIERNKPLAATIAAALLTTFVLGAIAIAKTVQASNALIQRETLGDAHSAEVLVNQMDSLYPATPDMAPAMGSWITETGDLLNRWPEHDRAGEIVRRGGSRLTEKQQADFVAQLGTLDRLESVIRDRRQTALELEQKTILDHAAEWTAVSERVASNPRYGGLRLAPQLGLVPLQHNPASQLEEFWIHLSGDAPQVAEPDTGVLALTEKSAIVLVLIPGGEYEVGDPREEDPELLRVNVDEVLRVVPLDAYFIAKHEVSQAQWSRIMGSNPAVFSAGHRLTDQVSPEYEDYEITGLHPVENVNWLDCAGFVQRLGLRLPADDEWEVACRGGERTAWSWGSHYSDLDGNENVADRSAESLGFAHQHSAFGEVKWDDGFPLHAPIDRFPPNGFGLCSMQGNVAEWCADAWTDDVFVTDPPSRRLFRGGSFYFPPDLAVAWRRQRDNQRSVLPYRGLRVGRSVTSSSPR
jgi:formylglycine-generating enzyme required for sulfatase activity